MKMFSALIALLFAAASTSTAQSLQKKWSSCFEDSTASFGTADMATDKDGNTYTAGYTINDGDEYYETHLYLIKVNADGIQEWIRYFSAQTDSIDNAKAVAVDASGNIYITGTRIDTFCNICTYNSKISDIITMKYDAAGNRIWLNRYHAGDYMLASPSDIIVNADGYCCVTGNELVYNEVTFVKENTMIVQTIAPNGKTIWLKKLANAVGNAACVDKQLNIYVAAASDPDHLYQTRKPMLVKYNKRGNLIWTRIYNEFNKNGAFYFVYADAANNVYANGHTDTLSFFNRPRIITIKYNGAGTTLWITKEEYQTYTLPHIYGGFKLDAAGNSYVTGYINVSDFDRNWITSKYNSAGVKQFTSVFNGTFQGYETPVDIAVNNAGSVFVTGSTVSNSRGEYAFATVAYNAAGVQQSVSYFKNGNRSNNFPVGVDVDNTGNVYVSGGAGGGLCTVKYESAGISETSAIATTRTQLKIYPNPVSSILYLDVSGISEKGNYVCTISEAGGTVLLEKTISILAGEKSQAIAVQSLKPGLYSITLLNKKEILTGKFLKQ